MGTVKMEEGYVRVGRPSSNGVTYRDALQEFRDRMASNFVHEQLNRIGLVDSGLQYERIRGAYPAWARELFGKPKNGERFKEGRDLKDSITGWSIPASAMKEVKGGDPFAPGIGLLVDPADLEERANGIVAVPKSIVVVSNLQATGKLGKLDKATGLPVMSESEIDPMNAGIIYYADPESLRPIVRGFDHFSNYDKLGSGITAYWLPSTNAGVVVLEAKLNAPPEMLLQELLETSPQALIEARKLADAGMQLPPGIAKLVDLSREI